MKSWLILLLGGLLLLGAATHAATLGKTAVPLDGRKVASEETTLGNFVADALRNTTGADAAILHAMAFRADALIPAGPVEDQAIRDALASPSRNFVTLKLTPFQLRNVFRRALSKFPTPNMAFLQFSGMKVVFDGDNPEATRVVSIAIGDKPLDLTDNEKPLKIAMPHELALGAVGYRLDFTDEVMKTLEQTKFTLLDAVTQEFNRAEEKKVEPTIEGRLTNLHPPKAK